MTDTLTPADFAAKADEAFQQIKAIVPQLEEARQTDTARYDAMKAQVDELGEQVASWKAKEAQAQQDADHASLMDRVAAMERDILAAKPRTASKAAAIAGDGNHEAPSADAFFLNLAVATNPRSPSGVKATAEANLDAMGSVWMGAPSGSHGAISAENGQKAILATSDATGGYVAPRAVVRDFTTVGVATNPYRSLLTVVTGIVGPTIEIPHIGLAPTRATVVARGATKTNVDAAFSVYSATFYTLAQITDAAVQWLRQTGGQGERIIRQRLGQAIALGESYYILNGSGSSEPKGLLTSLGTSGTFVTSHTASNSTIAGNFATAIAKASGAIANRNRIPDGVVMNAGDFWTAMAQGADAAGFYLSPTGGAREINATGAFDNGSPAMTVWGLPVYADPNMPADSLVVGAWKAAELYVGADYRIDTSTEAGDRWDKNLVGFRAEEDIAFNADPYVVSGHFQRIIDAVA